MFTEKGIEKIIINLDSNKAHEVDIISTHLMKVCDEFLIKPLNIICGKFLEWVCFPVEWKKARVPVHKKVTRKY